MLTNLILSIFTLPYRFIIEPYLSSLCKTIIMPGNTRQPTARILLGSPGGYIHIADFDAQEKSLSLSLTKPIGGKPSWLVFAPPHKLYAVDEKAKALRLLDFDVETNSVSLQKQHNGSFGVAHLALNAQGTRMVGSAYDAGTIDIWNVENGKLELIKTMESPGTPSNVNPRQTVAHPHQALLDPSNRFFVIPDLGTDSLFVLDTKDDAYQIVNEIKVTPGAGPRHGTFYPAGASKPTHYLLLCELGNEVRVFSIEYTADDLEFTLEQTVSTFDYPSPETACAAAIVISPDSHHLYCSNRLTGQPTDSIAHFRIARQDNGSPRLSLVALKSSVGRHPRMMSLTDDAKYLLVGTQEGDVGLTVFERDMSTGEISPIPGASIPLEAFGKQGYGVQYVEQIR
jgi:6-phosphogluconolactonase (cycloisomerase 2 family)